MKHQEAGLLKSSAGRGWMGVRAELRNHARGLIAERNLAVDTAISITVGGSCEAVVGRKSGKNLDECAAVKGTVWVCPAGIEQELAETSALAPQILHVYLPSKGFDCLADDSLRGADPHEYVRYANGYSDPLIAQCGFAIAKELHQETSAGRILVESIANTMAVRVIHSNVGRPPDCAKAALGSGPRCAATLSSAGGRGCRVGGEPLSRLPGVRRLSQSVPLRACVQDRDGSVAASICQRPAP